MISTPILFLASFTLSFIAGATAGVIRERVVAARDRRPAIYLSDEDWDAIVSFFRTRAECRERLRALPPELCLSWNAEPAYPYGGLGDPRFSSRSVDGEDPPAYRRGQQIGISFGPRGGR